MAINCRKWPRNGQKWPFLAVILEFSYSIVTTSLFTLQNIKSDHAEQYFQTWMRKMVHDCQKWPKKWPKTAVLPYSSVIYSKMSVLDNIDLLEYFLNLEQEKLRQIKLL